MDDSRETTGGRLIHASLYTHTLTLDVPNDLVRRKRASGDQVLIAHINGGNAAGVGLIGADGGGFLLLGAAIGCLCVREGSRSIGNRFGIVLFTHIHVSPHAHRRTDRHAQRRP